MQFGGLMIVLFLNIGLAICSNVYVVKHPETFDFKFDQGKTLKASELPRLVLATTGFTTNNLEWNGLDTKNTFLFPNITVVFRTNEKLNLDNSFGSKIPLSDDVPVNFDLVRDAYEQKFGPNSFRLLSASSSDLSSLSNDCADHGALVYVFDFNDEDVTQVTLKIGDILGLFTANCRNTVKADRLIAYLIASDEHSGIHRRQAPVLSGSTVAQNNVTNVAKFYGENYPVSFNLLFWTSLIIGLAVLFTSCYLWNMDPGSDTVIYRMTSQRLKKDN